jgi:hypothetical protein
MKPYAVSIKRLGNVQKSELQILKTWRSYLSSKDIIQKLAFFNESHWQSAFSSQLKALKTIEFAEG